MGSKNRKNKKLPNPNTTGNRVYGAGNKPITDERFSLSQKDPRFQDVPKHKNKVAIDSRFSRMFTDKQFSTSSARVDKRGKAKNDAVSSQSVLKHYYRMDNDTQRKDKKVSHDDDDVESDEEKVESESDDAGTLKDVKGKLLKPESESELESDSELESESDEEGGEDVMDDYTSTDTDEDNEVYVEEETNALQEEDVPEIDKETHRLAVVNLDWNQVQEGGGNLDAQIEALLNVEKQMTLNGDVAGTKKAAIDILEICFENRAWNKES